MLITRGQQSHSCKRQKWFAYPWIGFLMWIWNLVLTVMVGSLLQFDLEIYHLKFHKRCFIFKRRQSSLYWNKGSSYKEIMKTFLYRNRFANLHEESTKAAVWGDQRWLRMCRVCMFWLVSCPLKLCEKSLQCSEYPECCREENKDCSTPAIIILLLSFWIKPEKKWVSSKTIKLYILTLWNGVPSISRLVLENRLRLKRFSAQRKCVYWMIVILIWDQHSVQQLSGNIHLIVSTDMNWKNWTSFPFY